MTPNELLYFVAGMAFVLLWLTVINMVRPLNPVEEILRKGHDDE